MLINWVFADKPTATMLIKKNCSRIKVVNKRGYGLQSKTQFDLLITVIDMTKIVYKYENCR
jgi:hypothetical protein